jgi:hypothetical protein
VILEDIENACCNASADCKSALAFFVSTGFFYSSNGYDDSIGLK